MSACPWKCERCGANDWKIPESRWTDAGKKRWRVCKNCNHKMPGCTIEVPVPDGCCVSVSPDEAAQPTTHRCTPDID